MPQHVPPVARTVFSCDVDPIDAHLRGHGFDAGAPCSLVYRVVLPRLIELGAELGMRFVFFIVARDAREHAAVLREAHAAGHEIASHSFTHPEPFERLDESGLRHEIADSKRCLEDVIGAPVHGFRAPGLGLDGAIRRAVAEAGYRYDSSVLPSPVGFARQLVFSLRNPRGWSTRLRTALSQCFVPRAPHRFEAAGRHVWEFPLGVTPFLRYPVYHTLSHLVPRSLHDHAVGKVSDLSYVFHAVDLLDLASDAVDPRLSLHPGMKRTGDEKRQHLLDIMRLRATRGPVGTYAEWLDCLRGDGSSRSTRSSGAARPT